MTQTDLRPAENYPEDTQFMDGVRRDAKARYRRVWFPAHADIDDVLQDASLRFSLWARLLGQTMIQVNLAIAFFHMLVRQRASNVWRRAAVERKYLDRLHREAEAEAEAWARGTKKLARICAKYELSQEDLATGEAFKEFRDSLDGKELLVFALLMTGHSPAEIREKLGLTKGEFDRILRSLRDKARAAGLDQDP